MRASERDQVVTHLEQLKGMWEVEALREKFQKTQVLSKREMKILAALAKKPIRMKRSG